MRGSGKLLEGRDTHPGCRKVRKGQVCRDTWGIGPVQDSGEERTQKEAVKGDKQHVAGGPARAPAAPAPVVLFVRPLQCGFLC